VFAGSVWSASSGIPSCRILAITASSFWLAPVRAAVEVLAVSVAVTEISA
jgi:hypothetical protein